MELKPGLVGKHNSDATFRGPDYVNKNTTPNPVNGAYTCCSLESLVSLFRVSLRNIENLGPWTAPLDLPLLFLLQSRRVWCKSKSATLINRTGLHNRRYWGERFGRARLTKEVKNKIGKGRRRGRCQTNRQIDKRAMTNILNKGRR